eukprot:7171452-Lingulodinium_polyedra.AAC.1
MRRALRDEAPMPALPPPPQVAIAAGEVRVGPPRAVEAATVAGVFPPSSTCAGPPGARPRHRAFRDGPVGVRSRTWSGHKQ